MGLQQWGGGSEQPQLPAPVPTLSPISGPRGWQCQPPVPGSWAPPTCVPCFPNTPVTNILSLVIYQSRFPMMELEEGEEPSSDY